MPAPPLTAMILAAGRGERMRPLTDTTPKPLLPVRGQPMIVWHLQALAEAGVREVVINTAWLEHRFPATLGDGSRWGLKLHYSCEGRDHGGALDVAGGIAKALPLLGERFWLVSGDIVAPGFHFDPQAADRFAASGDDGHLWLVPNPPFHPRGDFDLDAGGRVSRPADGALRPYTFASIALLHARVVDGVNPGEVAPLAPCLIRSAERCRLGGSVWTGHWDNVGTPEQLAALNALHSPNG